VSKKTAVTQWIDDRLKADPRLAHEVDQILSEMRLEQDLAALREKRKLTQREVAKLLGTSQPYVAKLESGRVKNVGVGTLVRYARALGGTVTVQIKPRARPMAAIGGLGGNLMLRSDQMTKARKLLDAALELPARARGRLAVSLIDSLDGGPDADAATSWEREINRRLNALDAGKARAVPWTEVKRRLQVRRRGTRQR
jgi:putative addiction module component (TIGR02574 family)